MSDVNVIGRNHEKPYWFRSPWVVLFDLIRLHRVRPWNVDLSYLLTTLMGEMKREGYMDFTASGIALLSSATIYRMKSELILELQEPPAPPSEKLTVIVPPPIQIPFRYEYTTTSVDNLIDALEDALKDDSVELQPQLTPIEPPSPIIQEIDEFLVDIENKIERLYQIICGFGDGPVPFSKLTAGLDKLESIRSFLLVLFLACRGRIQLWQEVDDGEIYLSIKRFDFDDGQAGVKN